MIPKRVYVRQLVVGIFLLFIILGAVLYVYNPYERARQKRDNQRIADLESLKKSIDIYLANNGNESAGMCDGCKLDNGVFASQPITLKGTISAQVINSSAVNITGWIPIDFSLNAKINETPLSQLPQDPVNIDPYVYTYTPGKNGMYKLTAALESAQNDTLEADDGGTDSTRYEIGSGLSLVP